MWSVHFMGIAQQILRGGRTEFGIAADLNLFVVEMDGGKILGQAFIEPSLSRRIIEVQQHVSEIVGDCIPGVVFEQVERDEILINAGKKKAGLGNGLAVA